MTFFIWLLMLFSNTYSLKIKEMDSLYQYSQQSIVIQQDAPSILSAFRYGLWSKYNPLTNILQVGSVGLFESDCFLLHRAVEEVTQALNLIYYDCLDEASQKIKKTIAFIDNEDVQHIFTFDVDPFEYENVWYYFQISQWPLSQRFELIFIYQEKTIHEYLNIKYPFKDQNLLLIFGGGLIVQLNRFIYQLQLNLRLKQQKQVLNIQIKKKNFFFVIYQQKLNQFYLDLNKYIFLNLLLIFTNIFFLLFF